ATQFVQRGGLFSGKPRVLRAVDDVSFHVGEAETLGLVGESGCGKSTLGRTVLRLLDPASGQIVFQGRDIATLSQRELRPTRSRMQIIFQDPYGSLNPRMTVRATLREAMRVHAPRTEKSAEERALVHLVERVGLRPEAL